MEWKVIRAVIGRLGALDVEINDDRILSTPDYHCFAGNIHASVDFLVGDVRRNVNEVSRIGFVRELQVFSPAHSRPTSNDVDHGLQFGMMMGAGLGVGL